MVIQSLYRQDGLSYIEIAVLLDRHKSFVCRRLRLVEKLSDELLEQKYAFFHNPTLTASPLRWLRRVP